MRSTHLRNLFLLAAFALLLGAAMPNGWRYDINPSNPSANGAVDIEVFEAPALPVTVEFWVNGALIGTDQIESVPGGSSFNVPAGTSGKPYEVKFTSSGGDVTKTGTIS